MLRHTVYFKSFLLLFMPKQKKAHYKEDVPVKIYPKSEISEINVEKSNYIQPSAICLIRAVQRHEIQSPVKRVFFSQIFHAQNII